MTQEDQTPVFDSAKLDSPEALTAFEQQEIPIKSPEELAGKFVPEQERVLDHDTQDLLDLLDDVEIPADKTPAIKVINSKAKAIQEQAKAKAHEELAGVPKEKAKTKEKEKVIGVSYAETRESREPEALVKEFSEASANLFEQQDAWLQRQIEAASSPERKQFLTEWKERLQERQAILQEMESGTRNKEADLAIKEGNLNEVIRIGVGKEKAAYKPASGESIDMADSYGYDRYQAYRREWMASQINDAFGLDVVPPTAVRQTEKGIGSVQHWQNAELDTSKNWETSDSPTKEKDLEEISVLHFLTDQADGHYGNVMLDENGRFKALDNGVTFGSFDSISHTEALMRNGLDLSQASRGVTKIYQSEIRPELKSAPMVELLEDRAEPLPLNENLQENIKAFLADPHLQSGLHECFDAAFGDESGKKFGRFLNKLYELADNGLPPYKYPGKRRK